MLNIVVRSFSSVPSFICFCFPLPLSLTCFPPFYLFLFLSLSLSLTLSLSLLSCSLSLPNSPTTLPRDRADHDKGVNYTGTHRMRAHNAVCFASELPHSLHSTLGDIVPVFSFLSCLFSVWERNRVKRKNPHSQNGFYHISLSHTQSLCPTASSPPFFF